MGTEFTIYVEQEMDTDQAMDALDDFIHAQKWCSCEAEPESNKFAVWSARPTPESSTHISSHRPYYHDVREK